MELAATQFLKRVLGAAGCQVLGILSGLTSTMWGDT